MRLLILLLLICSSYASSSYALDASQLITSEAEDPSQFTRIHDLDNRFSVEIPNHWFEYGHFDLQHINGKPIFHIFNLGINLWVHEMPNSTTPLEDLVKSSWSYSYYRRTEVPFDLLIANEPGKGILYDTVRGDFDACYAFIKDSITYKITFYGSWGMFNEQDFAHIRDSIQIHEPSILK